MKPLKFGVSARLGAAFALLLTMVVVAVAAGEMQRRKLEHSLQQLGGEELDRIRLIDRWVSMSEATSLKIMAVNKSGDPALGALFAADIVANTREVGNLFTQVEAAAFTEEEKAWMEAFRPKREALVHALKEMAEFKKIGDLAGASAMYDSAYMPAQRAYTAEVRRYGAMQSELTTARLKALEVKRQRASQIGMAVVALLIAFGAWIAWKTTRHIKRSLDQAVHVAQAVSTGDLSVDVNVHTTDEFGTLMEALGHMTKSLECIVQEVRLGTDGVTVASGEIAQGNSDLSIRTEHQAGNLQQAAATLEQLTSTVRHNAATAEEADRLARQAVDVAGRGGEAVTRVVQTMGSISAASGRIEEIIAVIDGLAFQTNILALNAAVEAARAGEQGRGFAVVAGEVRSLAQRSAAAAQEIRTLISDSVSQVQTGTELVEKAGETMGEVVGAIQRVGALMSEINAATNQQTEGIADVNRSVATLDNMTQQNAALVEQAAAAAESLRQQAHALEKSVAVFRLSAASH